MIAWSLKTAVLAGDDMDTFLQFLVNSLFNSPKLASVLVELIGMAVRLVSSLTSADTSGEEKARVAVSALAEFIDEELDDVLPEWKDLAEYQRDRMLYGLVEWAYFLLKIGGGAGGTRKRLRYLRKALRQVDLK